MPWVNVAYWTLAIEFQWYLLVGLMFPLLVTHNRLARFAGLAGMMVAYFTVGHDRLIFHSLPIFLVGVFVFQYRVNLIEVREMLGLIAVMVLAMIGPIGWIVAGVSVTTGMLIAFSAFHSRHMDRVGDASLFALLVAFAHRCRPDWMSVALAAVFRAAYIGALERRRMLAA